MRLRPAIVALAVFIASCADHRATDPGRPGLSFDHSANHPSVRISEIHYDNAGTDAGEAIEISGPAGTDLAGWSVVLYNGNGGAVYNTRVIAAPAVLQNQCNGRGTFVLNYPVDGIQNGSPDAIALVNNGVLVEFLSYEGTQTGVGGAAAGVLSTDIGVAEGTATPVGHSLQRNPDGTWSAAAANTFGACNDAGVTPPPAVITDVTLAPASATIIVGGTQAFTASAFDASNAPVATTFAWSSTNTAVATVDAAGVATAMSAGDAQIIAAAPNGVADTSDLHVDAASPPPPAGPVRFSELHYDNVGTDAGEAIELEGPAGMDLAGWTIVLYNGSNSLSYNTRVLSGVFTDQCSGRGVLVFNYPQDGIQNGSPDAMALVNPANAVVEFLSYEGPLTAANGPAAGMTAPDIGVQEVNATVGHSLQRKTDGTWLAPSPNSFGACNPATPPPPAISYQFTGRDPVGDPPLPVGFQDQLFVTVRSNGTVITPASITWSSDSPAIATIDDQGVVTALAAGTAIIRVTTPEGTATIGLPTHVATAGGTAQYAGNAEFGEPTDADASDDIIIRRDQFTSSYNPVRRIPNWVSYNIDATHFGPQDRCDCFTFDPMLPAPLTRYTTANYTGAGAFHGFGIDRGHLARSFDRTSGSLDNATTYYFSNIIPQAADNNQGPWAIMENALGDFARFQNKDVYVIAGPAGNAGTLKNEGIITLPTHTWKVALILPRDQGLASVDSWDDVEVIAVIMPNVAGIRNIDWNSYRTTVDAVEALSGYDLLALLPDQVEIAVESNTRPPVASSGGPYTGSEGASITMSAAGSTDPDGDALTYTWTFGDGATATGASVSHTYANNGVYTVRVVATDIRGLTDDAVTTATVANVAPAVGAFAGATLLPGETYTGAGSFTDPGADSWSATVDYGDGSGIQPLALAGKDFSLSHGYAVPGTFTVTVRVSDGDDIGSRTAAVTVMTPAQGIAAALAIVADLSLNAGNRNALSSKLEAALASLDRGNTGAALNQLGALVNSLDALIQSGRLTFAEAAALRAMVNRIVASIEFTD